MSELIRDFRFGYIAGVPGAGKGTALGELIQRHKNDLLVLGTGDAIRGSRDPNNQRFFRYHDLLNGNGEKEKSNNGGLVSDKLILTLVEEILKAEINDPRTKEFVKAYLFDGVPRTGPQLETLNKMLKDYTPDLPQSLRVAEIFVTRDTAIQRALKRADDMRRQGLEPRPDDNRDTADKRYQQYMDVTYPQVIQQLINDGYAVKRIDGSKAPKEVARQVEHVIFSREVLVPSNGRTVYVSGVRVG